MSPTFARTWPLGRVFLVLAAGIPLVFLGICFFYPVLALAWLGVGQAGETGYFSTLGRVLSDSLTWRAIRDTLILALGGTFFSTLVGLPLAWVLYCLDFRFRTVLRTLVTIPFVLPTIGVAAAFKALFSEDGWLAVLRLDGTLGAVILAMVFYNVSLVVRTVGPVWARIDQRAYQAARTLGATRTRAFFTVTMQQLLGAIASAASLVFLYCSSSYSLVMVLGGIGVATLESQIYQTTSVDLDLAAAAVLALLQVVIVAVALVGSQYFQSKARVGVKLATVENSKPARGRQRLAIWGATAVIALLIVAPMAQVVTRSFRRRGQWTLQNYLDLTRPDASILVEQPVINSLGVSLRAAFIGAIVSTLLGALVAAVTSRHYRNPHLSRAAEIFDSLNMLPLGVSSVVIGLGFLITLAAPPWNLADSPFLLPIAQALGASPLVIRLMRPMLQTVNPKQRQAAATLGATPSRIFLTIDGPYIWGALVAAFGFAFAVCFGEFGAASFLVMPESLTLPVMIYKLSGSAGPAENGMAMAAAVILCLTCSLVMSAVEALRRRKVGEY